MDIDKLEGRELDAAVAEARGWTRLEFVQTTTIEGRELVGHNPRSTYDLCTVPLWHRSIAAAWELWKEMREGGMETTVYEEGDGLMSFYVCRDKCEECLRRKELAICYFHDLDELPTAIARAYLKAKASD